MNDPPDVLTGSQSSDVVEHAPRSSRVARAVALAVAAALVYAAGASIGLPSSRDRPARVRAAGPPTIAVERDGTFPGPVPLALRGWWVEQPDVFPADVRCVVVDAVQGLPNHVPGLAGGVLALGVDRRVHPDPAGRVAALVTCRRTTDGAVLAQYAVRPRAYFSGPGPAGVPLVVSEVPVGGAALDALAAVVRDWSPLTGNVPVYVVRVPDGGFEPRADVDPAGNVELPAPLAEDPALGPTALFHALALRALGQIGELSEPDVVRAYAALLGDASDPENDPPPAARALWLPFYVKGALQLTWSPEAAAASALTVLRHHPAEATRRLGALSPGERAAVRAFVRAAARAVTAGSESDIAALRALVPGLAAVTG